MTQFNEPKQARNNIITMRLTDAQSAAVDAAAAAHADGNSSKLLRMALDLWFEHNPIPAERPTTPKPGKQPKAPKAPKKRAKK